MLQFASLVPLIALANTLDWLAVIYQVIAFATCVYKFANHVFLAHGQSYTGLLGTQLSGAAGCGYWQVSYRSPHFALQILAGGRATIGFSCCPVTPRWLRLQVVF